MKRYFLAALLCIPAMAKKECAGLELSAVDAFLGPVPGAQFDLTDKGTGQATRAVSDERGSACVVAEPGSYSVSTNVRGFALYSRSFEVNALPATQVLVLKVGRVHDLTPNTIRGQLKSSKKPEKGSIWIVLTHVVDTERQIQRLRGDGTFAFTGDFAGSYEIHAIEDGKVVACSVVEIRHDTSVDLARRPDCVGAPR